MGDDGQRASSWLTFWLSSRRYAIRLDHVHEVVELSALTRLPQAPKAVLGVLDLRGTPLTILDLGVLLLGAAAENRTTRFSCVLVVDGPVSRVGLLVERVDRLIDISPEAIVPARGPGMLDEVTISGVTVRLLDLGAALAVGETPPHRDAEGMES